MLIRLLLILALFVYVLCASIPIKRAAVEREELRNYDKLLEREEWAAVQNYNKAISDLAETDPKRAKAVRELGLSYWLQRRYPDALPLIQANVAFFAVDKDKQHSDDYSTALFDLASLCRDMGDYIKAEQHFKEVLEYDRKSLGDKDIKVARDLNNLGVFYYMKAGTYQDLKTRKEWLDKAKESLEQSLSLYKEKTGEDSQQVGNNLWNLFLVSRDLGQETRAEELKKQAQAIDAKANRVSQAP